MRQQVPWTRRDRWIVNLTTAGLVAVGASAIGVAASAQVHAPQPPPSAAGTVAASAPAPARAGRTPAPHHHSPRIIPASRPTHVDIPAIGVHSALSRLDLNADGTVQVPASYQQAGWYDGSVTPGQTGPTVILGHVDSHAGPGVFFRLGALRPGDHVQVRRADRKVVTYTVTGVRRYPKSRFPTSTVYGETDIPTIRLITCGGAFDSATGHYVDNIVAFGQLVRH